MFISNLSICNSFAVKPFANRVGEIVGTTIGWESCETKEMRHRPNTCALILNSHESMCKSCSSIKVNSFYKTLKHDDKENISTSSKKRESYMTPDEIKEKLSQEKKRRRIVDRRQYQCEKLLSEMKTMDENDCDDVREIFDGINMEELGEDMVISVGGTKASIDGKRLQRE